MFNGFTFLLNPVFVLMFVGRVVFTSYSFHVFLGKNVPSNLFSRNAVVFVCSILSPLSGAETAAHHFGLRASKSKRQRQVRSILIGKTDKPQLTFATPLDLEGSFGLGIYRS